MMKKSVVYCVLAVFAGVILFCSGCGTVENEPDLPDTSSIQAVKTVPEQKEMDLFARQSGENMLRALRSGNYKAFCRDVDESFRNSMRESNFREIHTGLGNFVRSEYLCGLHNPLYAAYLWKLTFNRSSMDSQAAEFDTLFQISVIKQDDRFYVVGCWFR